MITITPTVEYTDKIKNGFDLVWHHQTHLSTINLACVRKLFTYHKDFSQFLDLMESGLEVEAGRLYEKAFKEIATSIIETNLAVYGAPIIQEAA